jgi:hypothetical protein
MSETQNGSSLSVAVGYPVKQFPWLKRCEHGCSGSSVKTPGGEIATPCGSEHEGVDVDPGASCRACVDDAECVLATLKVCCQTMTRLTLIAAQIDRPGVHRICGQLDKSSHVSPYRLAWLDHNTQLAVQP